MPLPLSLILSSNTSPGMRNLIYLCTFSFPFSFPSIHSFVWIYFALECALCLFIAFLNFIYVCRSLCSKLFIYLFLTYLESFSLFHRVPILQFAANPIITSKIRGFSFVCGSLHMHSWIEFWFCFVTLYCALFKFMSMLVDSGIMCAVAFKIVVSHSVHLLIIL